MRDGPCWATRRCPCQNVREGHRTHQTSILLEVSFLFIQLARGSLLFDAFDTTMAWQGRLVLGIEEASFLMSVHRLNVLLGGKLVGPRPAGESEKQHGGVGVDVYFRLVLCCVCFWCGLAWLACLPVRVVYVSLWWGGVWGGWVAKRGLCWATRWCSCQTVRGGHRTHQKTILLEVSFLEVSFLSFSLSLQAGLMFLGFDTTKARQ